MDMFLIIVGATAMFSFGFSAGFWRGYTWEQSARAGAAVKTGLTGEDGLPQPQEREIDDRHIPLEDEMP